MNFLADAGHDRVAVSIDGRSAALPELPQHLAGLAKRGVDCRILYLEASVAALLRRFSETRRRHPLASAGLTLTEAIERERALLAGRDESVQRWLGDVRALRGRWLPEIVRENRSYVTVAIGCPGGRHRSVYLAEQLAQSFRAGWRVLVRHRGLAKEEPQ